MPSINTILYNYNDKLELFVYHFCCFLYKSAIVHARRKNQEITYYTIIHIVGLQVMHLSPASQCMEQLGSWLTIGLSNYLPRIFWKFLPFSKHFPITASQMVLCHKPSGGQFTYGHYKQKKRRDGKLNFSSQVSHTSAAVTLPGLMHFWWAD